MGAAATTALQSPADYKAQMKRVKELMKEKNWIFNGTDATLLVNLIAAFTAAAPYLSYHFFNETLKHEQEKLTQYVDDEHFEVLLASVNFVNTSNAYFDNYLA